MRLTLELISTERSSCVRPAVKHFSDGGMIGRSADSALQIEHSSVSRQHASVLKLSGVYFIQDNRSTNGVYIGNTKLTTGEAYAIQNGDIVQIDIFRFRATLEQSSETSQPGAIRGGNSAESQEQLLREHFSSNTNTQRPIAGSYENVGVKGLGAHGPAAPQLLDVQDDDPLALLDAPKGSAFAVRSMPLGGGLLGELDQAAEPKHAMGMATAHGILDDGLDDLSQFGLKHSTSARPVNNELLDERFVPPAIARPTAPQDELDDEDGWGLPSQPNYISANKAVNHASATPARSLGSPDVREEARVITGNTSRSTHREADPGTVAQASIKPAIVAMPPVGQLAAQAGALQAAPQPPAVGTSSPVAKESVPQAAPASNAVLSAFVNALGIPDLPLTEQSAGELGFMVKALLDGSMELLRAQSEIKAEFRLPVTRMKRQGNNPFKSLPRAEEALVALFMRRSAAYLPATQAVEESLADLRAHQLAMIGGLRDAYAQFLETLSPKSLETRFANHAKESMFASKDAQMWKNYVAMIDAWRQQVDDSFIENFGQDFAESYERHVESARIARQRATD